MGPSFLTDEMIESMLCGRLLPNILATNSLQVDEPDQNLVFFDKRLRPYLSPYKGCNVHDVNEVFVHKAKVLLLRNYLIKPVPSCSLEPI